ncbi:MAG TPA: hypothetical protein VK714_10175 [Myxococcota bacterium]|nr:hypothetical protein [Myxococcota bacterium]
MRKFDPWLLPEKERFVDQYCSALAARISGLPPTEYERPFYPGASIKGVAENRLAVERIPIRPGVNPVDLALATTSDFPWDLENVFSKVLLAQYGVAAPTYRRIAVMQAFRDFRPVRLVRVGEFGAATSLQGVLFQVNEHGEIKAGTPTDGRELITMLTWAKTVNLSRQVLVNDNLKAFARLAQTAAMRVAEVEDYLFFAACFTPNSGLGPALADTYSVFHANHSNIGATGVLSATTLGSAMSALQKQKTADGSLLNLEAATLLVSPDSRALAESTVPVALIPELEVVSDANLSGARFYVLADAAMASNYLAGGLDSEIPEPTVLSRRGFTIDGVEIKVVLDFAAGCVDYRAGSTGAGA